MFHIRRLLSFFPLPRLSSPPPMPPSLPKPQSSANGKKITAVAALGLALTLTDYKVSCVRAHALASPLEMERWILEENLHALSSAQKNLCHLSCQGESPLIFALNNKKVEAAKKLIELGSDVNCPARSGLSPLMLALQTEDSSLILCLLDAKPDLTYKNPYTKENLWHFAVRTSRPEEIFPLLTAIRPLLRATDYQGRTPVNLALQANNQKALDALAHFAESGLTSTPSKT